MFVCMSYVVYVAFIANMDYVAFIANMDYVVYVTFIANMDYVVMWIVWGMLWGTH